MKGEPSATAAVARLGDPPTFSRILDELARSGDSQPQYAKPLERSFATLAPTIGADAAGESDPAGRWDEALDWAAESPEAGGAAKPARPPSDDPESIAAELGLADAQSHDDLNRARRRFMWDNHPDRRPDVPRELANRRVAIANMLVDRAHRALARRRGVG